jgi:hypothetical protein
VFEWGFRGFEFASVRPSLMSNFKTLRLECWHFIRFMLEGYCMCGSRDSTSHRSADELSDSLSQNSRSLNPEDLSLASSQPYLTLRFSPSRHELAALR